MFGRKKAHVPDFVVRAAGVSPIAATRLAQAAPSESAAPEGTERWVGAWKNHFALVDADGSYTPIEWSDFATGVWDAESHTLTLSFIDPSLAPLVLDLDADYSVQFLTVLRERIDASIVHQVVRYSSAGAKMFGQVRRNADGTLFTQVYLDPTQAQLASLAEMSALEAELRDAVGL